MTKTPDGSLCDWIVEAILEKSPFFGSSIMTKIQAFGSPDPCIELTMYWDEDAPSLRLFRSKKSAVLHAAALMSGMPMECEFKVERRGGLLEVKTPKVA